MTADPPAPTNELPRRIASSGRLTPAPRSGEAPHVLLLDDEPAVQVVLARTLENRGFRVFASTAWSEVARRVFECRGTRTFLVADLNMPGIRGEDFCRIVKSYHTNVVLVLYTGAERVEVEAASQRLGGVRFVLKEQGAAKLCSTLESLRTSEGAAS